MTTKNYARSVRAKLLNISKEENVFYQSILTRYFQDGIDEGIKPLLDSDEWQKISAL